MSQAASCWRRDVRPEGVGDLGDHPRTSSNRSRRRSTSRSTARTRSRCRPCSMGPSTSPGTRRWRGSTRNDGRRHTCRAIAMRDTDRDRRPYLVARIRRLVRTVSDLAGPRARDGRIGFPASDADSARPGAAGGRINPDTDLTVMRFDVLVGKHGDHVGGELDAFRCLQRGEVAACAMLDLNWDDLDPRRHDRSDGVRHPGDRPTLRSLRVHRAAGSRRRR